MGNGRSAVDRTMGFVDLLFRTPCFRSWLHREDYKFENEVDDVVAEGPTSSFSFRNHRPKRYFALLGFKDRNLEDEYLEDLARSKKASVFVGYAIAIVLFFVGSFLDSLQQIPELHHLPADVTGADGKAGRERQEEGGVL